jgi:three-Cys-motif partner protein
MLRRVDAMAHARLVDAEDGFKARVAPIWTEEKLAILAGYLPAFAKATKGKAPGWYVLDLFAGGGLNYSEAQQTEIPGSPLIALEAGSPDAPEPIEVVMAEEDDNTFAALEHRTAKYGGRAQRFHDDSNRVIDQMLARLSQRAPAFAFLDPGRVGLSRLAARYEPSGNPGSNLDVLDGRRS